MMFLIKDIKHKAETPATWRAVFLAVAACHEGQVEGHEPEATTSPTLDAVS